MAADIDTWMIYGANGYTGQLVARLAVADGQRPILAGRSRAEIEALANELNCPARVFSLATSEAIAPHLEGLSALLHCAGPFSQTARPMIEACLRARVNYLDITGELDVIEFAAQQHERTLDAGVSLMPAVGFDVVPSDCLAARLAAALPTATRLELAFQGGSAVSPGTARTMFAQFGNGGRVRIAGQITRVPVAWKTMRVPFASGVRQAVTIPWGDVSTAFYTTGIPNIEVYTAVSKRQIQRVRRWRWLLPLVRLRVIQWLGQQWIKRRAIGPSESQRASGRAEFWGRVTDDDGRTAEAVLTTPEGYSLTACTALEVAKRTSAGEVKPGFWTPAQAFGASFIEQFEGFHFAWRTRP